MSDEIRVNRSQQPMQRPDTQPQMEMTPPASSKMPWVILAVVVVVIIVLGLLFRDKLFGNGGAGAGKTTATDVSKPSGYQAVFLTNGQVYFGKISDVDSDYVGLTDIFYLQVGPQQGSATAAGQPAAAQPQQQISLVKLGNELHGPVDQMHISRSQILFYEDLKSDGQVVKAILSYKATPAATPAK